MAQPADRPGGLTNLQKRTLSAAVLLPVVILAIALGHPYFSLLVAVFAGIMAWEWTRVVAHIRLPGQTSPVPIPSARAWRILAVLSAATVISAVAGAGLDGMIERAWMALLVGVVATAL